MRLYYVGDGERDSVMVPYLVRNILGVTVTPPDGPAEEENPNRWARLHGVGRRYGRKLLYAMRQTIDRGADGLVATVDTDDSRRSERLRQLQQARDQDCKPEYRVPTALGAATPHGEAWLIDAPTAVREELSLPANHPIPATPDDPKAVLEELFNSAEQAPGRFRDAVAEIAKLVTLEGCNDPDRTGFKDFVDDVQRELGPLVPEAA